MKKLLIGAALLSISATSFAGTCSGIIQEIKEKCNVEFSNTSIISAQRDRCYKATNVRLIHSKGSNELLAVNLNSCDDTSEAAKKRNFKVYNLLGAEQVVNTYNKVFFSPTRGVNEGKLLGVGQNDKEIQTFEVLSSSKKSYSTVESLSKSGSLLVVDYKSGSTELDSDEISSRREDKTITPKASGDNAMEDMGISGHKKKVENKKPTQTSPRPTTPDYGDSDY